MASDKLNRLLNGLKNATAQGKVVWEDSSDEDLFRLILANGIIQIGPEKEKRGIDIRGLMAEPLYVVTLLNENDQVVEVLRVGPKDP
jgi:hypothetical protein